MSVSLKHSLGQLKFSSGNRAQTNIQYNIAKRADPGACELYIIPGDSPGQDSQFLFDGLHGKQAFDPVV
jgi:hypothetical protein